MGIAGNSLTIFLLYKQMIKIIIFYKYPRTHEHFSTIICFQTNLISTIYIYAFLRPIYMSQCFFKTFYIRLHEQINLSYVLNQKLKLFQQLIFSFKFT